MSLSNLLNLHTRTGRKIDSPATWSSFSSYA